MAVKHSATHILTMSLEKTRGSLFSGFAKELGPNATHDMVDRMVDALRAAQDSGVQTVYFPLELHEEEALKRTAIAERNRYARNRSIGKRTAGTLALVLGIAAGGAAALSDTSLAAPTAIQAPAIPYSQTLPSASSVTPEENTQGQRLIALPIGTLAGLVTLLLFMSSADKEVEERQRLKKDRQMELETFEQALRQVGDALNGSLRNYRERLTLAGPHHGGKTLVDCCGSSAGIY